MADIRLHRAPHNDMAERWLTALTQRAGGNAHNNAFIASLVVLLDAMQWLGSDRKVVETLPYGIDDLTTGDLRDILARLGFQTRPLDVAVGDVSERLCPFLFEDTDGNPYVVLEHGEKGSLIFDGVKGARRWETEIPVGTCFIVKDVSAETSPSQMGVGDWLRDMAGQFRSLMVTAFTTTFFINLMALAAPLTIMAVYDQVIGKDQPDILPAIAVGFFIAVLFEATMRFLRAKIQAHISGRMDYLIGTKVFEQILHLPPTFTERAPVGGQVARLREFETLREFFTGPLATAFMDLPFVIVFLAVIALIAGPMTIIPLVLIALYTLIGLLISPTVRERGRSSGEARSSRYAFLVETIWWLRSIKEQNGEETWQKRFRALSADACWSNYHLNHSQSLSQEISQTLMTIAGVATLGLGVSMTMDGTMTLGGLIATMMLIWRVLTPIQSLFGLASRAEQMIQSIRQLTTLLSYQKEQNPGDAPSTEISFRGGLSFNRVSMRYSADGNPALLGVDFSVKPGEFLGITGSSGSGKSTLAKVALGIYRPQAGSVTIDGVDIRQLRPITLRQTLAYVPQKNHAFPGTIFENVAMASPTASYDDVVDACRLAGILGAIQSLPHGFETRFREGLLAHVPQGFLRKLGLARAFLRDAPVLVLDEPAGSMDDQDEQDFIAAIEKLRGSRTIIMITHRPSHMHMCDRLLVLDHGHMALIGTPDEVLTEVAKRNIDLAPPPDSRPETA